MKKSLEQIQLELHILKKEVFKDKPQAILSSIARALNANEEAGELAREERLSLEGFEFNEEKAKDAVGDILISTLGYCIAKGWDAQEILEQTYALLEERWRSGVYSGMDDLRIS